MTGLICVSPRDGLVFLMLDGDDRYDDLLQHRSAVNEARAANEVETIGRLGNPELHVPFRLCRDRCAATPYRFVLRELMTNAVAFLCQYRPFRLLGELALLRFAWRGLGKEKAMICSNDNMVTIEVVDDIADERRQFINRGPHSAKVLSSVAFLPVASTVSW